MNVVNVPAQGRRYEGRDTRPARTGGFGVR
jgi:hypothetical protein